MVQLELKKQGFYDGDMSVFSLLGNDENALSSSFAYILSKDMNVYFNFMRLLGLNYKLSKTHYAGVIITIQKHRAEGFTDIEIQYNDEYHIIIECKIHNNKVKSQREQYLKSFKEDNAQKKILVFLTQLKENFSLFPEGIITKYLTWEDILGMLYEKKVSNNDIYMEFVKFVERGYKMTSFIKEILVQDVGDKEQILNFKENFIYRRPESAGRPLYFAPYFTRQSGETEGIIFISKILGVLTIKPRMLKQIEDDLKSLATKDDGFDEDLILGWTKGIREEKNDKELTFYFLDKPIKLKKPVLKSKTSESKGWIGGLIPRNRSITFQSLIEHM